VPQGRENAARNRSPWITRCAGCPPKRAAAVMAAQVRANWGLSTGPAPRGRWRPTGVIPITVPELLRLLRDTVIPPARRDRPHRLHWSAWRRRHHHRACQAHQRWNTYAETTL
jgi:hypothetical protein